METKEGAINRQCWLSNHPIHSFCLSYASLETVTKYFYGTSAVGYIKVVDLVIVTVSM
jgi:hypothetical protein